MESFVDWFLQPKRELLKTVESRRVKTMSAKDQARARRNL